MTIHEQSTGTAGSATSMPDEERRGDLAQGDLARDDLALGDGTRDDTMRADTASRDTSVGDGSGADALFAGDDAGLFRERWQKVQARFVDDPQGAVHDADSLVSDVTESLASRFAEQKATLEQQWSSGEGVDTENLRMTLQRYRTLFERLLAA